MLSFAFDYWVSLIKKKGKTKRKNLKNLQLYKYIVIYLIVRVTFIDNKLL